MTYDGSRLKSASVPCSAPSSAEPSVRVAPHAPAPQRCLRAAASHFLPLRGRLIASWARAPPFETHVHFTTAVRGRKRMLESAVPAPRAGTPGRVPQVARLVALAHRFASLVESGEVADYADVARLAGVTRARVTQVIDLLHLAPDIQAALLDMPRALRGPDRFHETDVRRIRGGTPVVKAAPDVARPLRLRSGRLPLNGDVLPDTSR